MNKTKLTFSILLALNFAFTLEAQTKRIKLSGNINSASDETNPVISPDGTTLYFVRSMYPENTGGEKAGQDIWVSKKNPSGEWSKALNLGAPVNNSANNSVCGISADGKTLYLANIYKKNDKMLPGISSSTFNNGVWETPIPLDFNAKNLLSGYFSFFISANEKQMIISMQIASGAGQEDLYVSTKEEDGKWTIPVSLGKTINTSGFETSPFLTEDGKTLYFCSDGQAGLGKGDIFVTTRLDESWTNWSSPKNLGPEINTAGLDNYFCLSKSGDAYFVSGETENEPGDIYTIKLFDLNNYIKDNKEEPIALKKETPVENITTAAIKTVEVKQDTLKCSFEFDRNSAVISSAGIEKLTAFEKELKKKKYKMILVNGYADATGNPIYNQPLSQKRANEVKAYLMKIGVAIEIKSKGYGTEGMIQEKKVLIIAVPE